MDFVLGDAEVAIEAKGKRRVHDADTRHLLQFRKEHPGVREMIVVCLEEQPRVTDEGVLILPYAAFLEKLWLGDI